ncbi:MAG: hypothetical protein ACIRZ0_09135, partial [Lactobacillus amylovorus]
LGNALVAGKNLVPNPAAGIIAFLTFILSIPSPKIIIKYILKYSLKFCSFSADLQIRIPLNFIFY